MKKTITLSILLLIALILVVNVSAYQRLCLTKGDSVNRFTCDHDLCTICVTDKLYPTDFNYCNKIAQCKSLNENSNSNNPANLTNFTNSDTSGPKITIETLNVSLNSPLNNKIYPRAVLFDIKSEREVDIYYRNENSDGDWSRISINKKEFLKKINFKEGLNNITIRAVDKSGYERNFTVGFYVDSQKPRIRKTSPSRAYANGSFNVQFMEQNPKSLVLRYGNLLNGYKNHSVDLGSCFVYGSISNCDLNVNLSEYNNQKIYYWFVLKDIAGNSVESKHIQLGVDTIKPVISNSSAIFKIDSRARTVLFNMSISESNLANVAYFDNSQRMPKWNNICTKLANGYCIKKLTFTKGFHSLDIRALDNAGNYVTQSIEFEI